ncbi:MAG: SDR family oxidoreductase [Gemmobacter sp.]
MSRTAVVTGISGQQQGAVARAFRNLGWQVRGIARGVGTDNAGETCVANLDTGEGLGDAFKGAAVVAFTLPQDHRDGAMSRMAHNVGLAARAAGVRRLVLNLAGTIDETSDLPLFREMRAARDAIQGCGVPSVVLSPTVYMDNLLAPWSLPGIVGDGVLAYPAPPDAPISWLSHKTLADFMVAAAERDEAAGQSIRVGGPAALTGHDLARVLGERLARSVTYRRIPLVGFAAGLNDAFGPPAGDRIASLYALLDEEPRAMEVTADADRVLGVRPERFEDFIARHDWTLTHGAPAP